MLVLDYLKTENIHFFAAEGQYPKIWRWQKGREIFFKIPKKEESYEFRFSLEVPGDENRATIGSVYIDGCLILEKQFSGRMSFWSENVFIQDAEQIRFTISRVNSIEFSFAPQDPRELGFCFTKLNLISKRLLNSPLCPMPFTRIELNGGKSFVPCCAPWLTDEYHNLAIETEDVWNSLQAEKLRESIYNGDYKFCKRDLCHTEFTTYDEIEKFAESQKEFLLTQKAIDAIKNAETKMPTPTESTLLADARCNLKCPSCRPDYIYQLSEEAEEKREKADLALKKFQPNLNRLRIAGDGEPLFSKYMRDLIRNLDMFPKLQLMELHTNGLLLNEKTMTELLPGSKAINRVLVSIDAGDEETYKKVRGGNWTVLNENLRWVSKKRKAGEFLSFNILFVYRLENYRSMYAFSVLGKDLNADGVYFSPFQSWARAEFSSYKEEAIHLSFHKNNSDFLKERERIVDDFGSLVHFT
ncbi:MAG: hypothetical protein M9962_10300 [Oligoflexia bacterium]|nr:hypothetical protein [Oligoflexia bacterium]